LESDDMKLCKKFYENGKLVEILLDGLQAHRHGSNTLFSSCREKDNWII